MTAGDAYVPLPATAVVTVFKAVAQVASDDAYSENVIVPVGDEPPLNTAESCTTPPSAAPADAVVAIAGTSFAITTCSAATLQAAVAAALSASPP